MPCVAGCRGRSVCLATGPGWLNGPTDDPCRHIVRVYDVGMMLNLGAQCFHTKPPPAESCVWLSWLPCVGEASILSVVGHWLLLPVL